MVSPQMIWTICLAGLMLAVALAPDANAQRRRHKRSSHRRGHSAKVYKQQASKRSLAYQAKTRRYAKMVNMDATGELFQQPHVEGRGLYVPPSFGLPASSAKGLQPGGATNDPLTFNYGLKRGTNLSHWLSQSAKRGQQREEFLQETDIDWIKSVGLDHVRLPVDEEQLWDQNGVRNDTAFVLMHKAIGWCMARNMKVILDLHIIRSHYFNAKSNTLWTSEQDQNHLLILWRDLSEALKGYPNSMLAYELMNEPVAPDPAQWNSLVSKLHRFIRVLEPDRWIVIGSNMWQATETFDQLQIPEGDPHIVLSFHFYEPFFLTHYKAAWVPQRSWTGRVRYPGYTFAIEDTTGQDSTVVQMMKKHHKLWDARALDQMLAKPLALSRKMNLPLYCGEWGCYQKTPMPDRLRWYQDMRRIFELHRIPWANWDYKGSFGLKLQDGTPCQEIMVVLLDAPIKR